MPVFAIEQKMDEQKNLIETLSEVSNVQTNPVAQTINIIYMDGSNEQSPGTEIARFEVNANDKTNTIRLANTIHTVENWESYVTKENQEFLGWKFAILGDDLNSHYTTNSIWTGEHDIYMYAQYEITEPAPTPTTIDIIYMDGSNEQSAGTEIARFEVNANDKTNTIRLANTIHTVENWESYVTKENQEFLGWKCAMLGNDLNSQFMTNSIWTGEQDLYMYAQYEYTAPPITDTFIVTFKDSLMGENLGTLEVTENYNLTQSEISVIAPTHTNFEFIGWSVDPYADEVSSIINITENTFLYPIYVHIGALSDRIDTDLLSHSIILAEGYQEMLDEIGVSDEFVSNLPTQDANFYEYLNNYMENNIDVSNSKDSIRLSNRMAETIETAEMAVYAVEMAEWSKAKRPELNLNDEVVYMFMSHFVDIQTPFEVSRVDQHSESGLLAKWITDYCRRCYDQYFETGSATQFKADVTKSVISIVDLGVAKINVGAELVETAVEKAAVYSSVVGGALTAHGLTAEIEGITTEIMNINATTEEEFIEKMEAIRAGFEYDMLMWYENGTNPNEVLSIINGLFGFACAVALGGGPYALIFMPFAGFYVDTAHNLMDRANYAALIRMRNFRTAERTYYYLGMSDGRN